MFMNFITQIYNRIKSYIQNVWHSGSSGKIRIVAASFLCVFITHLLFSKDSGSKASQDSKQGSGVPTSELLSRSERKELIEYMLEKLKPFDEKEILRRIQLSPEIKSRCKGIELLGMYRQEVLDFKRSKDYKDLLKIYREMRRVDCIDKEGKLTGGWKRNVEETCRNFLSQIIVLLRIPQESLNQQQIGIDVGVEVLDFIYCDKNIIESQVNKYEPNPNLTSTQKQFDIRPNIFSLKLDKEGRGYMLHPWAGDTRTLYLGLANTGGGGSELPLVGVNHLIYTTSSPDKLEALAEEARVKFFYKFRSRLGNSPLDERARNIWFGTQEKGKRMRREEIYPNYLITESVIKHNLALSDLISKIDYKYKLGEKYDTETKAAGEVLVKSIDEIKSFILNEEKRHDAEKTFVKDLVYLVSEQPLDP
jgi:hypothetical protein